MGNKEIIKMYRSAGVPEDMSNESILQYHKSGFGTDKAQIAGKYYEKFEDEAVIAHEYYNIFKDKLDKSSEYYGIFEENTENAQEYYELFKEVGARIVEGYCNIFGKSKANTAYEYYNIFGNKVYEAYECFETFKKNPGQGLIYYKTFENNLDMAYAYYCKFGDRLAKVAFEYYKQFDTDIDIAREYYGIFGSSKAEIAKKYYDFFGTKEKDLKKQRSLVADYYQTFGEDIEKAKESYEKEADAKKANIRMMPGTTDDVKAVYYDIFGEYTEIAKDYYDIFSDNSESAKDYYGIFGKNTEIAKDYYDIFSDDLESAQDYYGIFGKNTEIAKDYYGIFSDDSESAYNYYDIFKDNFERANEFYEVFGDKLPPEIDDWVRKTTCTAKDASEVLKDKVAPSALADVDYVLSLLPKLRGNSMLKFWEKYGTTRSEADEYVAYLRENLTGFSEKRWSGLALEHVIYGARPDVAKWLAKSELSPSQVQKVVANYGDSDVWDVTLEEAQQKLESLVTDVADLSADGVDWSKIWKGKVQRSVVSWCKKFDGSGAWVGRVFSKKARNLMAKHKLRNVLIARFLYCPMTPKAGTTNEIYLSLGNLLNKNSQRLPKNVQSGTRKNFAKRAEILYNFLKRSADGKTFIKNYWKKGKNAAETNAIFSKRKEIHNKLKELLNKYSPD